MARLDALLLLAALVAGNAAMAAAQHSGHSMVCTTTPFTLTKTDDDTSNGCNTAAEQCMSAFRITSTSGCVFTMTSASANAACSSTTSGQSSVAADWLSATSNFQAFYLTSTSAAVAMNFKITRGSDQKLVFTATYTSGGVTRTCAPKYSDPNFDLMVMANSASLKTMSFALLIAAAALAIALL